MHNCFRATVLFACVIAAIAFVAVAPAEQKTAKPQAKALHEKTAEGVTVRIEKVAVERVLNEPGWAEGQLGAKWQERLANEDPPYLPARFFRLYVSVFGHKRDSKVDVQVAVPKVQRLAGVKVYDPDDWVSQIKTLRKFDPTGNGYDVWVHVGDTPIEKLFPNKVTVKITSPSGKTLVFEFDDVRL